MAQIKADGYDGGYSQLTAFIRAWRGGQGKESQAFVPLIFALGQAFQFDWSEEGLLVGGIYRRMPVSYTHLDVYKRQPLASSNCTSFFPSAWSEKGFCPVISSRSTDRKSTRLNSSHITRSRMPSSA